jgi:nucleolar protein 16
LEAQAANVFGKHESYQSEGEKRFIEELIQKYGDDYDAMFRDIKLNIYQHTVAQLRKKSEK